MKQPHWTCKTHGDFDAEVAVGCPECVREARVEIGQLTEWLDRLLYTVDDDHMTACDRTIGDSHPCTCGATEIRLRRAYRNLPPPGVKLIDPSPNRRYDEVYRAGVAALDNDFETTKDPDDLGEAMAREYIEVETEHMRDHESVTEKISE